MKLLNIILTVTREHKNLELTLDSIDKIKQDKDISVIVISNEVNIKRDLLKRFKFESKIIQSKKKYGPLYQEALDNCKCEYVTFIDAGDVFDTNGMRQIIGYLMNKKDDVLRTDLAETYLGLNGKPAVGIVNYSYVETPHAHFFKINFLKEKGLKFNEKLDVYALDNFYRNSIYVHPISILKITTYLSGFKAIQFDKNIKPKNVENIDEYYDAIIDSFEFLQGKDCDYNVFLLIVLFSLFVIVESVDFDIPTLIDKKRKYENIIFSIYEDYKNIYDSFDDNFKNLMLNIEFEKQRRSNINHRLVCNFMDLIKKMNSFKIAKSSEKHFLDIIVPEYEGEEFIFDFLDSLEKQKDVNFEEIGVIIVNDDSPHKIKPYKFKRYGNLNIEYIINEKNVGQGMTRQHGIDYSKAEYITMFDQDDIFYPKDDHCLSKMLVELKNNKPNVAVGNVIEEAVAINGTTGEIKYCSVNPGVFVHGLYCKREFLNENNYKFNPKLRQLEDTYFNKILLSTNKATAVDVDIYFWRNNRKSQVRQNGTINFSIKSFDDFCICTTDVYEFTINKAPEFAEKFLLASIYGTFFFSNSNYSLEVGEDKMKELQLKSYKIYKKYEFLFKKHKDALGEIYESERTAISRSMHAIKPLEPFDAFINRMAKEYPDI